jgi:hypothetical protein
LKKVWVLVSNGHDDASNILYLKSRIYDSIGFQSRDEYIEYPEENKDTSGNSLDSLKNYEH